MRYSSLCEVREYLDQPYCELYAGYISIYGKSLYCETWHSGKNSLIPLYNTTLFYDEDGNKEFGGYGEGCSFVSYNGKIHYRPILLAKEIKGE